MHRMNNAKRDVNANGRIVSLKSHCFVTFKYAINGQSPRGVVLSLNYLLRIFFKDKPNANEPFREYFGLVAVSGFYSISRLILIHMKFVVRQRTT